MNQDCGSQVRQLSVPKPSHQVRLTIEHYREVAQRIGAPGSGRRYSRRGFALEREPVLNDKADPHGSALVVLLRRSRYFFASLAASTAFPAASFAAIASWLASLAASLAAPAACDAAAASAGAVDGAGVTTVVDGGVTTIGGEDVVAGGVTTTGLAGRLSHAASVSATTAVHRRVLFMGSSLAGKRIDIVE